MTDIREVHLKVPDDRPPVNRRSGVSDEDDLDDLSDNVFFDPSESENRSNVQKTVIKDTTNDDQLLTLKPFGYNKDKKNLADAPKNTQDSGVVPRVRKEDTEVTLRPFSYQENKKVNKDKKRISAPVLNNEKNPQRHEKTERGEDGNNRKQRKLVRQERVTSDELTLRPIGPALIHNNSNGKYVSRVEIKDDTSVEIDNLKKDNTGGLVNNDKSTVENGSPIRRLDTIDVPVKEPKKGRMVYKLNGHPSLAHHDKPKTAVGKTYSGTPLIHDENQPEHEQSATCTSPQHELPKHSRLKRQRGNRSVSFNQDKDTKLKEGAEHEPGEMTMSKKFRRFARQMSETSAVTSSIRRKHRKRPNTFFDLALFACCCCCSPLGGLGMVFAVMSDTAHKARDYQKAGKLRKATLGVSVAGIFLTIMIITILLITHAMKRMGS